MPLTRRMSGRAFTRFSKKSKAREQSLTYLSHLKKAITILRHSILKRVT